ncbi:transcription termination factor MTERF4, chloroplastic [Triticum aestivum]|nr:transcription termination factor MTERF4, chloroplastic-like [Triticum aestivum]
MPANCSTVCQDGLVLTVDVMRERVKFLRSLGLGPDDLAAYPLALGSSVRKNMVPVLDYLGKIGVRRDELPHLLRRYPQVLHAGIVVDLAPVVKYLQGVDVKPDDVPRVLERYPELLGFKLEGTCPVPVHSCGTRGSHALSHACSTTLMQNSMSV